MGPTALFADSPWQMLGQVNNPVGWAVLLGAAGFWLMLPWRGPRARVAGAVVGVVSLGLLVSQIPAIADLTSRSLFWLIAGVTVASAAATVTMRSPMYSAIWFAMTLLGTACLLLMQGAQFLAVATVAVYAGAILVTFLFVLMLAQSEGRDVCDRIGWGRAPEALSALAGAAIVGLMTVALGGIYTGESDDKLVAQGDGPLIEQVAAVLPEMKNNAEGAVLSADQLRKVRLSQTVGPAPVVLLYLDIPDPAQRLDWRSRADLQRLLAENVFGRQSYELVLDITYNDVLANQHVAHFGGQLFSRHLISIEVAGTLLLIALVGAVAIVAQATEPQEQEDEGGSRP